MRFVLTLTLLNLLFFTHGVMGLRTNPASAWHCFAHIAPKHQPVANRTQMFTSSCRLLYVAKEV